MTDGPDTEPTPFEARAGKKKEITRTFKTITEKGGTQREQQTGTVSPPEPKVIDNPDEGVVVPDPQPIPEQEPFKYGE